MTAPVRTTVGCCGNKWQRTCAQRGQNPSPAKCVIGVFCAAATPPAALEESGTRRQGGGQLFLTDEEIFSRMAVQEKEAVVLSLFEEVQKRQNELSATRQRCGELREGIAFKMQEECRLCGSNAWRRSLDLRALSFSEWHGRGSSGSCCSGVVT
ncbi:hypothetical protein C3747_280g19 [Trypanosoma cruzi]|uniref:Uncharacterized protein n=1 Tax=Trypanosoma cruzi TaxID=5693 RepID=A0A2V2VDJ8_TRYCR|nr:hypothetical protein C3747_280g19 [Trypanosoma cruzi]